MTKKNRSRPQRARAAKRRAATRQPAPPSGMVDADSNDIRHFQSTRFPSYSHGRWHDTVEWLRGKLELTTETRLAPIFGLIGDVPARLFGGWGNRARMSWRSRRRAHARFLWSWNEQGVGMLKKLARIGLAVMVSVVVLAVLIVAAQRVASAVGNVKSPTDSLFGNGATTNSTTNGGAVTIRNGIGSDATMPPAPEYTLGMWASDMTPGGTTTIYARLSHDSAPVPGITVSISYNGRSLASHTNAFGIAAFTIPAGGAHGQPVTVSGSVRINGQEIDADTFYTP